MPPLSSRSRTGSASAAFAAFYADGYRDGTFKPLPPQILTALISGPIDALAARVLGGVVKLEPGLRQEVLDACWDAITL